MTIKTKAFEFDINMNNGPFWDHYVKGWEKNPENKNLSCVGSEWHGEEIFLEMLKLHAGSSKQALEIGCGGGRITSKAVNYFKQVHAADVSKEMMRKNAESVSSKKVSYHHLDGFTLGSFQDESVDFIFSHDVFVHFSSLQVYPYFKEIKRVLKPGSKALISFYNFRGHFERFKEISVMFNADKVYPPHMRIHFVTEEMIRLMLEDLGLEVVTVQKENFLIFCFQKKTGANS